MRRLLSASLLAVLMLAIAGATPSASAAGQSFVLHLKCEDGIEADILVPSAASYAGLVIGSNGVVRST